SRVDPERGDRCRRIHDRQRPQEPDMKCADVDERVLFDSERAVSFDRHRGAALAQYWQGALEIGSLRGVEGKPLNPARENRTAELRRRSRYAAYGFERELNDLTRRVGSEPVLDAVLGVEKPHDAEADFLEECRSEGMPRFEHHDPEPARVKMVSGGETGRAGS